MKKYISMFEIPSKDFSRAVSFYQAVLDIKVEEIDMGGIMMGLFPGDGSDVSGAIVRGEDYQPSSDGVVIYLNGGYDSQLILDKVEANGGTILVPKTLIGPEMGYYGIFMDTEGNKLGVYSQG